MLLTSNVLLRYYKRLINKNKKGYLMTDKPTKKRRIRSTNGATGKTVFIPFYVDLDKLKKLIESERKAYQKAMTDLKIKELNDRLKE
jgi:hypothetical protein